MNKFSQRGSTIGHDFKTRSVRKNPKMIAKEKKFIRDTNNMCPRCGVVLDKMRTTKQEPILVCWPCNVVFDRPEI